MNALLSNPIVQSAAAPFLVTLSALFMFRRMGWYWGGFAALLGFYAAVYLITEFQLFPLRSTNKILLLGLVAIIIGSLLDLYPWSRRHLPKLLAVAAAVALLWVIWPLLKRKTGIDLWLLGGGAALYAGWMVATMEGLREKPLQADCALLTLTLGTGLAATLGASTLLGQLASALAAACGARWLLHLVNRPAAAGSIMLVPITLLCALIGFAATVYAQLPWYTLPLFALIPLLVRVPLRESRQWLQLTTLTLICALPAAIAVYLTWQVAGALPW